MCRVSCVVSTGLNQPVQLQPSEAPQPQPLDVPLLFPQRDDNVDRNEQQQQQETEQPPEEVMMEVVELVSETTASMMVDGASPPQVEPYDSPTLELSSSSPCLSPSPPPRSPMSPVMASLSAPPDESGEAPAYWLSGVPHISVIPAALAFQLDADALPPAANDSTSTAGALSSESLAAAAAVETAAATILADVGAELEKIAAEATPEGVPAEDKERPLPLSASSATAEAPGEQPQMAEPQHEPAQPQEQRPVSAEGTSGQEEHAAATAVEGSRQEEEEEEEIATKAGEEEKRTTTEGKAGEEAEKVPTKTPSAADHPVEVPTEDAQTEVAAEVRAKEEEEEEEQPEEPFQHLDLLKRDEIVVELQKLGLPVRSSISGVCGLCFARVS